MNDQRTLRPEFPSLDERLRILKEFPMIPLDGNRLEVQD